MARPAATAATMVAKLSSARTCQWEQRRATRMAAAVGWVGFELFGWAMRGGKVVVGQDLPPVAAESHDGDGGWVGLGCFGWEAALEDVGTRDRTGR